MAQRGDSKDLLSRLAEAGEEAIKRLGDAPGADRLADVANTLRGRVDELQKKVRGQDELERRVADLEQRLAALEPKPAPRKRSTTTAAKKKTSS